MKSWLTRKKNQHEDIVFDIAAEAAPAFRQAYLEFEHVFYSRAIAASNDENTIVGVVQKERLTAANRALSQALQHPLSQALQHLFTLGFNAQDLVRAIAPCRMKDVKRLTWTAWVQAEWQLFESRGGSQDLANQMLSQVIDAASYEAEKEHRLAGEDQAIQLSSGTA